MYVEWYTCVEKKVGIARLRMLAEDWLIVFPDYYTKRQMIWAFLAHIKMTPARRMRWRHEDEMTLEAFVEGTVDSEASASSGKRRRVD